jgi:RNA polymerase sigma-70 factor (ECF subfamily)
MEQDVRERALWLARNLLPHEPLLRARLGKMYVHGLDIDDVIQETYARIVSLPSLETIRYPRQYAIRTATSIIIDHIRHSKVIAIESAGNLEQLEIATQEASPEQQLEYRQQIVEIAAALDTLPPMCRQTLILRRVEGLSQRETAQRLKISEKTVEKHMARGVLHLMEHFGRGGKSRARPSANRQETTDDDDEAVPAGD